ncbi:MAG: cation-translocating P-type ATPase [Bacteroidia bacterium]|nr:cation-translocating P-type ATPase [Bacteroidia bacterium]
MSALATEHIELNVKGMTCTNCALGIQKYLEKEGAESIFVDFSSGEVIFDMKEQRRIDPIMKGIRRLGYEVDKSGDGLAEGKYSLIEKLFALSAVFTLPLLLHMVVSWHWLHNPWVQLALATPVFLVGMWHFGRSAISSLKSGVPNMDVLIVVGAVAAFGYSLYGTLTQAGPDFLFYETAASIITLVLLGNVMEHRAVKRTTTAMRELSALQPQLAIRLMPDGKSVETVPVSQVEPGDVLQVNDGDKIPVDGRIVSGDGAVDSAMITGESTPEDKHPGDAVVGGTVLVAGQIRMEATSGAKGGTLSRIIEMVKRAQADKPQIQQLADRISAIFVPVVLTISLLTFLLSWLVFEIGLSDSIIHSVAVLVIACPCAMGLATPTAVVVGLGRASKMGILVKGGRTLEAFANVRQVVFDKTGTLTTGRLSIRDLRVTGIARQEAESVVLALEQHSSHPIAKALQLALAGADPLTLTGVRETKGLGLSGADDDGNLYQLGSFRLVTGQTEDLNHDLFLLKNNELVATLDLEDEIRPEAAEVIDYLKTKGIKPILLTGDRQAKAERVAAQLGIAELHYEQLPDEKLAFIETQSALLPTAMVGDGINDAPALARASVGISLGDATQVAIQSAEVVLLSGRLTSLRDLRQLSEHTVLTIKQNLFWAFFYNSLAIPLAAFGFLRPIIGAATMAMSDVVVIGNSLRLKVKKIKE